MKRKTILSVLCLGLCGLTAAAQTLPDPTLEERLRLHVETLTADSLLGREGGSETARQAAAYIERAFEEIGLQPGSARKDGDHSFVQRFERHNTRYANIVGFLPGNDPRLRNEYIILGAHYDHLGFRVKGQDTVIYHGADDNASGTAVLIETARRLKEREHELKRTVLLVAFDGEEEGLYGSEAMVENMAADNVKFMASIDMVGWLRGAETLQIKGVGTLRDGEALFEAIPHEGLTLRTRRSPNETFTASDHNAFTARDIPAVLLTTGSKSPYHRPEDTAEKLDYAGMAAITAYTTEMAVELATCPEIAPRPLRKLRRERFNGGITAGIGSSALVIPRSALNGRERFSWNAGLTGLYNINDHFTLRADLLYHHRTFRFPEADPATGNLIVSPGFRKLEMSSLTVPVAFLLTSDLWGTLDGYLYLGLGGYYSYTFGSRINGVDTAFNPHAGGIDFQFGWQFGHLGIGCTVLGELSRLFPKGTMAMRGTSTYFTVTYLF